MKNLKLLPVLAAILAMSSAFTFGGKKTTQYYTLDGNTFMKIEESGGDCIDGAYNCAYESELDSPDLVGHPEQFDEVGAENKIYQPPTK